MEERRWQLLKIKIKIRGKEGAKRKPFRFTICGLDPTSG